MFDTIKLYQSSINLKSKEYLSDIPYLLSGTTHSIKDNGMRYTTGHLENLKITVSEYGIFVNGSLNKFWHDYNYGKLTRQEAQMSIEKLQDLLKVEMLTAKVNRIDIAHNFIMDNDVRCYYDYLGDSTYYKRLAQPDSLYYNSGIKTKLFYDKVKEGKTKGAETPKIWSDNNVLRYELRFLNKIPQQFKKPQLLASDLYEESFYISIVNKWIDEYLEIKKNRLMTPKIDNMTSKNTLEYLLSAYIDKYGQDFANEFIETNKGNFSTSKELTRSKKKLQDLKGLTEESPLMKELDGKVLRIKEYYR